MAVFLVAHRAIIAPLERSWEDVGKREFSARLRRTPKLTGKLNWLRWPIV
jgi:hypothetical protein